MRDGYLCLVRCRGNSLYTGISTDVERRFWARRAKAGAKYPKGRGSLGLICPEKIGDKRLAHRGRARGQARAQS